MRCRVVSVTLGDKQNAQTKKKVLLALSSYRNFILNIQSHSSLEEMLKQVFPNCFWL